MNVVHKEDRFHTGCYIPFYKIYDSKRFSYFIAFDMQYNTAYIDERIKLNQEPDADFNPTAIQKKISIQQIFLKLKGLIDE